MLFGIGASKSVNIYKCRENREKNRITSKNSPKKKTMEFVSSHILHRTASSRAHFSASLSLAHTYSLSVSHSLVHTHIIRTFAAPSIHYATAEEQRNKRRIFFYCHRCDCQKATAATTIAALDLKIWFEGQAHSAHGIFFQNSQLSNHIMRMNILNINLRLHI